MRRAWLVITIGLAVTAPAAGQTAVRIRSRADKVRDHAYQGRNVGPEQTDRFSGKYRIGRDGRVSITNIAGDITVTAGPGEEVTVEAIKRTRGGQSQLDSVRIEVDNGAGRLDIRTVHPGRSERVSVDYTVTLPSGASLDVRSVSGSVKVTGVRGSTRVETISGGIAATDTPRLSSAKSVSGNVTLSGLSEGDSVSASTVSGNVTARSVKARTLELGSVSGEIVLTDITAERVAVKSVSGNAEYSGSIARGGSYEFNVHSGTIRLALANPAGFVLNANSFSGAVRSELPLTIGANSGSPDQDRRGRRDLMRSNHSIRATYGDGSATVTARTFSGDIIINKR